ncbi:MAG: hypothetical protein WBP86_14725 [Thiobacillaceae bacterium]
MALAHSANLLASYISAPGQELLNLQLDRFLGQPAVLVEPLCCIGDHHVSGNAVQTIGATSDGLTTFVPRTMTSGNKAHELYDKRDFVYIEQANEHGCPAGEWLAYRLSDNVPALRPQGAMYVRQGATGQALGTRRGAGCHAMQARPDRAIGTMKQRRCTVEHVFGTLQFWMGSAHFLMTRLTRFGTEMSLHVLAYNLREPVRNFVCEAYHEV